VARVELSKVVKRYPGNDEDTVKSADLIIENQEFLILVGPSGCGKSTTLRMIAGLEEITGGTISIGDRVVNDVPPKDRDIAMVFQNYALYPHMNVYENMAFGLRLRKFPEEEIDQRVQGAAETLGLVDLLDRKPKALSGGQRQRVALGRAIVREPAVFLMDEPLSNLDAKLRVQMRAEIGALHKRLAATMIYVTHDQTEAMTMGDRIAVFHEGVIQQCAAPQSVYDNPTNLFVAGFIGSPHMNMFKGTLKLGKIVQENVKLPTPGRLKKRLASLDGRKITFGIRPEDVHVKGSPGFAPTDENAIEVELGLLEPMGAENFLYLNYGKSRFVCRVPSKVRPRLGETLTMSMNLSRAHIFDGVHELAPRVI
jgi:multiple sugar transport system ATP-binding protein